MHPWFDIIDHPCVAFINNNNTESPSVLNAIGVYPFNVVGVNVATPPYDTIQITLICPTAPFGNVNASVPVLAIVVTAVVTLSAPAVVSACGVESNAYQVGKLLNKIFSMRDKCNHSAFIPDDVFRKILGCVRLDNPIIMVNQ